MKRVFLSHNSKDKPFVKLLASMLSKHGIMSWVDEAEILPGDSLIDKISDAIDKLDFVIAVISSNSIDSGWVRQELEWALTKEINNKKITVIPVLIERCDIPFFLLHKLYADYTEPDNYEIATLKLATAINRDNSSVVLNTIESSDFGAPVLPSYKWTNFNTLAAFLFFLFGSGFCFFAKVLPNSMRSNDHEMFIAAKSGLFECGGLMILFSFAALIREVIFRAIIQGDPNFARDVGMIRVTGFPSIRYARVLWKYKGRSVVKALFLIDSLIFMAMIGMIYLVLLFIPVGLKFM